MRASTRVAAVPRNRRAPIKNWEAVLVLVGVTSSKLEATSRVDTRASLMRPRWIRGPGDVREVLASLRRGHRQRTQSIRK